MQPINFPISENKGEEKTETLHLAYFVTSKSLNNAFSAKHYEEVQPICPSNLKNVLVRTMAFLRPLVYRSV